MYKNKQGAIPAVLISIFAIIGVVAGILWVMNTFNSGAPSLGLQAVPTTPTGQVSQGAQLPVSLVEDTTITLSSWDFYAEGTNAGTGHLLLQLGNSKNIQVNDDGTQTASPQDAYRVLLGNRTTSLTSTQYYPTYVTGTIPDKGTFTIGAGQYNVVGQNELTFTFFNDNDQVNTAQALTTNDKKTPKWRLTAPDNGCIGNPSAGGENGMTYRYNTSVYTKVVQIGASGADQTSVGTPTAITSVAGYAMRTYNFPVVCDNNQVERKVRMETGVIEPVGTQDNVSMWISDVSIDYDANTLALIMGYEDEANNDIGIADYQVGYLIAG